MYFINGNNTGNITGSIIRVDPNDIVNGQSMFYQGLNGGGNIPTIATDGNYLYTVSASMFLKIDASTATLVLSS